MKEGERHCTIRCYDHAIEEHSAAVRVAVGTNLAQLAMVQAAGVRFLAEKELAQPGVPHT